MRPSAQKKNHTSFAGDVLKLVTGTVAAQGLTVIAAPILTRLYGPEAFGKLAIFISIITILGSISCLRYELSIMLPESDEEAANLLGLSIGIAILSSALTVPVFWFGKLPIATLLKTPDIQHYLWMVPPAILFSGIFLALNFWNSRTKHFGRLSMVKFFRSFTTVCGQLGAGYAGYTTAGAGLIGGSFAGYALSSLILGYAVWQEDSLVLRKSITWSSIKAGLKRYANFPLYNTWITLLNTVSWQLPVLMLGIFFSPQIVGYYALGYRMISIPMNLIGQSVRQVFFQRAAEANTAGKIDSVVENSLFYLVSLSLLPISILLLTGEDIFLVFFGPNWVESGVYVQILAVWLLAWFVSSPVSNVFVILERQSDALLLQVMILGSRILSLWLGGVLGEPRIAIALFSISGFFAYGYLSLFALDISGVSIKKSLRIFVNSFKFCLPSIITLIIVKLISFPSFAIIIIDIILIVIHAYIAKYTIINKAENKDIFS